MEWGFSGSCRGKMRHGAALPLPGVIVRAGHLLTVNVSVVNLIRVSKVGCSRLMCGVPLACQITLINISGDQLVFAAG